jgi:phage repressor protein C with HTH and peptisase S24 domain
MKSPKSSGKLKRRKLLFIRRVVGKSMQPTLQPESLVLASGLFRRLAPDQVVVVRQDGLEKVKRIQKLDEGRVFVVGDNSRQSIDSRSFGWLPAAAVVGRVIWPRD